MKISIITLGIAIAFLAGSTLVTSCGSGNSNQSESTEQHDMGEHSPDKVTAANYTCPMHPEEMGEEGDKCSKCGMALVLNEVEESGDGAHNHED